MRGITLETGTIVVLSLDGTLVFVEDVQPTWAAVVALPEQLTERTDERVFTPGKVGVKKISPYSSSSRVLAVTDLTPRNVAFIKDYVALRDAHGPHFVQRTPEEEAAMAVTKIKPSRAEKRKGRAPKGETAEQHFKKRCAQCNEQPGHPNHPGDHTFVEPEPEAPTTPAASQPKRPVRSSGPRPSAASVGAIYALVSSDLTKAKAQPRGDRYNDGNRSYRVVLAISTLPNCTGTLEDVVAALAADGGKAMTNPAKVARRTLNQLTKADFGACVTRTGGAATDDSDDSDD